MRLVTAARVGSAEEIKKLVLEVGADCDTIISEFGAIGSGRNDVFTMNDLGFAEERTALVAAVEAGWLAVVHMIIELAKDKRASLDVVCHEWNPSGIGGSCLRANYTALDQAKLYHRTEIFDALLAAGAQYSRQCPHPARENPFIVKQRRINGDYFDSGWQQSDHKDRYADFTFAEFEGDIQMDDEMRKIVSELKKELRGLRGKDSTDKTEFNRGFKKLCLRWHPDKHPEEKKGLATRVFQWLQRTKLDEWESKAWTA